MALERVRRLVEEDRRRFVSRRVKPGLEHLEDRITPISSVTLLSAGLTPTDLVQNLVGPSIPFSNVTFAGTNVQAGIFTGGTSSVGIETGIILSSGDATGVIGPGPTTLASTATGAPGDADLDVIAGTATFDAAVLEFDMVPDGNVFAFTFVFASEEYPEFVGSINDAFAFFINGQNVSFLPGTTTPITINTVNQNVNTQFFVNNEALAAAGTPLPTNMDGFTVVLPAVLPATPGQSVHIKLAVADAVDRILDSNVFIAAGGLDTLFVPPYRPLRYVFVPDTADPENGEYAGNITLNNTEDTTVLGPTFIFFPLLPTGVTVASPTGTTGSGFQYVAVPSPGGSIPAKAATRIEVRFRNPQNVPLSTFFLDYAIQITGIVAI